jgi:hypothetical protein
LYDLIAKKIIMALNPNHIPGIYNYCDRWCERCTFTSKCAVYSSEQACTPEETDVTNKAFWYNIGKNLADAITLLHEVAEKEGIDLTISDSKEIKEYEAEQKKGREIMAKHPLIKYSKQYMLDAKVVLTKNELLNQKAKELLHLTELGVKNIKDTKHEIDTVLDSLEIVQWYLIQIQVKFMRAMPTSNDDTTDETFISDSNGSAKVALIAVDRCLMAWQNILQFIPAAEDDVLPLLALLQKIRILGEHSFPNARAFVRVGLDE